MFRPEQQLNTVPWSSGQDASLSRWNQGFDSPRHYQYLPVGTSFWLVFIFLDKNPKPLDFTGVSGFVFSVFIPIQTPLKPCKHTFFYGIIDEIWDGIWDENRHYSYRFYLLVRNKPEALVYAIKDAQKAANYMDWKAGLLTDREYVNLSRSTIEIHPENQVPDHKLADPEPER